jgi:hypothetical protein
MQVNLETYLRGNYRCGTIDHTIRCQASDDDVVSFYIHPSGKDGATLDFMVLENKLIPMQVETADGTLVLSATSTNISRAEICEWKIEKHDDYEYYHTNCNEIVQSILPIAGMKFCPYCSRKLRPC